ncbi:hypothetical protein [uncultured Parabacteroides sp.]|uniref:HU family DNA-binding protein n=1 Tax=uncultured Parabacteroides sp. TaxID=512312 RepID=UPI0025CFB4BA|nr:hypothetical protein [uncultured Parabacteroides sp.]MCD7850113.1 hypothetical protein [Parabacteroides sp.]
MAIKFTINETPKPNGRKGQKLLHARQQSYGTYKMDYICSLIGERSAVSSAEVKSVLDSLAWVMDVAFSAGYHLELEDLGYFSPSLRTRSLNNKQNTVELDGVNFRCSGDLLKKLKKIELTRVDKKKVLPDAEERKSKMLAFLSREGSISPRIYAGIIGCSRYRAEADLKQWVEEGILVKVGYRNKTLYLQS